MLQLRQSQDGAPSDFSHFFVGTPKPGKVAASFKKNRPLAQAVRALAAIKKRSGIPNQLCECPGHGYPCPSIVGTVFAHTKPSLPVWFLAIYLMTQSKNAPPARAARLATPKPPLKRQAIGYKIRILVAPAG